MVASGKTWSGQLTSRKKDGSTYMEQASIVPVTDDSGVVSNFLKLSEDITRRISDERELLDHRNRLEDMVRTRTAEVGKACASLDAREELIVTLEGDQTVAFANSRVCQALGLDRKDVEGRNWFDAFVAEDVREQERQAFLELLTGVRPAGQRRTAPIQGARGRKLTVEWLEKALFDDKGSISGAMIIGSLVP